MTPTPFEATDRVAQRERRSTPAARSGLVQQPDRDHPRGQRKPRVEASE